MKRLEFNQLILEWNEYLLIESICENLEDQVLVEGVRSFIKKHGQTVGLLTFLMSQLVSTGINIKNDIKNINNNNNSAIIKLAKELGEPAVSVINRASEEDINAAVNIISQSDVNQVDLVSYITRSFKNSFEESLEESLQIKSFGGIYSKEVYDSWGPSILRNDKFVNEVFNYLNDDKPPAGKNFEYKGMKIFIFPFDADEGEVADAFVENFFKQIQITIKKNNKKIKINARSDLDKLSEELSSLSINFELKLFKSELKGVFKGIVLKHISNKSGVTGYHYNIQAFSEEFKNAAENVANERAFKDLQGKIEIEMNIGKGGVIAIDNKQSSKIKVLRTISHELGHALSIDQGKDKTIIFNDFIKFLLDNYDLNVEENNKKVSLDMFEKFIENRLFKGVNWKEIKSEKQDFIMNICLDFLEQLESSNFLEIIKSQEGVEIQLNIDILDSAQRYYHNPEERPENFKDFIVLFDQKHDEGSAIKVLTEIKSMIEYVKENPEVVKQMKKVFSEDLDTQIRFFITKAMLDLKIVDKNSRNEAFESSDNSLLIRLIKNDNTRWIGDCLDGINNLIKMHNKLNNRIEHNAQHSH